MLVVHIDSNPLNEKILNKIDTCENIIYKFIPDESTLFHFLSNNKACFLVIGEKLKETEGLNLIHLLNNSDFFYLPILYLVNSKDDHYLEDFSELGIHDCVYREELTFEIINKHLSVLLDQKRQYKRLSNITVAVIDDSPLALEVVTRILKAEGIENIRTYTDPSEALDCFECFSLYIVDLIMPGLSGDKLIFKIRELAPHSIVIAMSAVDHVKTITHVLNNGADDYVVKPFNSFELMARIGTHYRSFMLLEELEKKNRELAILSVTDSLTRAYNYGYIMNFLKQEVLESKVSGSPLSLLCIDLDNFKEINDAYGHSVGDDVLITLSTLITSNDRSSDVFGRMGGEEFILIMTNTEINKASTIASGLCRRFASMDIHGVGRSVTFSGGLAQWDGFESYRDLLKRADEKMYEAKTTGKNRVMS